MVKNLARLSLKCIHQMAINKKFATISNIRSGWLTRPLGDRLSAHGSRQHKTSQN